MFQRSITSVDHNKTGKRMEGGDDKLDVKVADERDGNLRMSGMNSAACANESLDHVSWDMLSEKIEFISFGLDLLILLY